MLLINDYGVIVIVSHLYVIICRSVCHVGEFVTFGWPADIRRDLHWLSINHRISYKLSLLTWKALYTVEPSYLPDLISPYIPARTLLYVPPTHIF